MQGSAIARALGAGLLVVAACARAPEPSEAPAPVRQDTPPHAPATWKSLAQRRFGGPITEKTSTGLDVLLHEPSKFQAKTVRTEGVVSAVCKAMGCWMEISQPGAAGGQAHIKMAGHSFFVPKEASGHRAIVQGTVVSGGDTCEDAPPGAVARMQIEATAVEFVD